MKTLYIKKCGLWVSLISIGMMFFAACEKGLDYVNPQELNGENFPQTADDASAAVTAIYAGMMQGSMWSGWTAAQGGYATQAGQTTDEAICNWDDGGSWVRLNRLTFDPDFASITNHYGNLMRFISRITAVMPQIEAIDINPAVKGRYIGELKALRAYFMQMLYLYYGPVPVVLDPSMVNTTASGQMPRPTKEDMIGFIESDFNDAIAVLPDRFTGADYGRFSKAACLTSLMKLYMQEKRWQDAINMGNQIKAMGFSLTANYADNFNINAKGGNSEIILAIVCNATAPINGNIYRPHYLPSDYYDASNDGFDTAWGGYRMPWKTYDKFDQNDDRLRLLLDEYPTQVNGVVTMKNARTAGEIGAVMLKYASDPGRTNSMVSAIDIVVMRYADVELLLAEAINEISGATQEAFDLLNDVRVKHGKLAPLTGLNQANLRLAIQNERLFELWSEGARRDDLIRWGQYIQRARDDGFSVADHLVLYPLPRTAITESNGIVEQNPGYN